MKYAVVTGAAGLLGSAVVQRLLQKKYKVICYIEPHHPTSFLQQLGVASIVQGKIYDQQLLESSVPRGAIIFHCYSLTSGANASSQKYFKENVFATKVLLQVAEKKNASKVVYVSSAVVYAPSRKRYLKETDPVRPQGPYAKSKYTAERLVQQFHHKIGIPSLILRQFPIYGQHAHPLSNPARLYRLVQQRRFYLIDGGRCRSEFCYSKNAAQAMVLVSEKVIKGLVIVNIAEPIKRRWREVILTFSKEVQVEPQLISIPLPLALVLGYISEILYFFSIRTTLPRLATIKALGGYWKADCTLLRSYEYKQSYTLEQGIKEFVQWLEKERKN